MELRSWLLWVVAAAGAVVLLAADAQGQKIFTNTWAVHIPGGPAVADRVAQKHGFHNLGQIFGDYYHFWHRAVTKRSLSPHRPRHSRLQREPQVKWLEQQVAKRRAKRDVYQEPTDPKFPQQWYLSGVTQRDLNVKEAWAQGFTGHGIVVSILDDGIEKNHPDLAGNYDPGASFDVNDQDPDPQPRYTQMNDNRHGTRCAGEVAAVANNGVCGVGVAYNASLDPVEQTCSRQSQSSRESRPQQQPPALRPEVEMEPRLQAGLASHLPEVLAGLSCLIIVLIFGIVFLFLHRCSGFSFRGVKVYTMDRGLISYKGLPPEAWQEECPSDSEEDEGRGERTAFIKDQSAL